jgi:hypothetical protein
MYHFDMAVDQNFAIFRNTDDSTVVIVESFNNVDFEARIGTVANSTHVATFTASSDSELNGKLCELFNK